MSVCPPAVILVVEDHADSAAALLRLLALAGFEPAVVYSAGEALQSLSLRVPSAVVLDCNLPDMPGLDMLAALRADDRTRRVPVIVNTADGSPERRARARALGADAFVVKGSAAGDTVVAALHMHVGDPIRLTGQFTAASDRERPTPTTP